MPKFAPPGCSLPGEPKKPLFISKPSLGEETGLQVVPSRRNIAPVVKSVAGPPITQPSLLVGVVSVIR